MNDLLGKLRQKGKERGYVCNEKISSKVVSTSINVELQDFIKKNKEAQTNIKTLKNNNILLKKLKEGLTNSVSSEEKGKYNQRIGEIIETSSGLQTTVKNILTENASGFIKDLEHNNFLLEQEKRISKNLHGATVKNFQDTMLEFQSIEADLKTTNEKMIIRSAEVALGKKLTDEEKIQIVSNPEMVQTLMQEKLSGQAHTKLVNAVRDLEDRHAEIRKLENSIMQVHQLIEELAALVKLQGEMVDNICDNIAGAKEDVLQGEKDIVKAKKNMQAARKKKCIILIIVVVILAAICIPIIVNFA